MPNRPGGKPVSQLRSFLLEIGGGDGAVGDAGTLGVGGAEAVAQQLPHSATARTA
jgi:hypothetical protein